MVKRYSKIYFLEDKYIDFDNRTIVISKNTYDLTNKQFKFLEFLSRHESYVNNEEIESYLDTSRAVIRNIVSKLKNDCQLSNYIDNKKEYGYKLLIPSDAPEPEYITYDKRDLVEIMYDGINFEVSQVYLDKLAILEEEIDVCVKSYHKIIASKGDRDISFLITHYENRLKELISKEQELRKEFEKAKENNMNALSKSSTKNENKLNKSLCSLPLGRRSDYKERINEDTDLLVVQDYELYLTSQHPTDIYYSLANIRCKWALLAEKISALKCL